VGERASVHDGGWSRVIKKERRKKKKKKRKNSGGVKKRKRGIRSIRAKRVNERRREGGRESVQEV
jgi:hypothetical protein